MTSEPGLYFLGLEFQYAFSSVMVQGAGRDAEHVVKALASRVEAAGTAGEAPAELAAAQQE